LTAGIAGVVLLAAILGVVAKAGRNDAPERHVYLVGDSLVLQGAKYWLPMMEADGWTAREDSFAGTNTCDWFNEMEAQRDEFRPSVVAISFGGNDATECMHHRDGSKLTEREFFEKYRDDTRRALDIWGDDVSVYLVAPPAMYDGDNRFAPTYMAFADERPNVHFVDGGRYLTPGHQWRKTAPCLPDERCTGPVIDGVRHNVVRSADTVHFCPVDNSVDDPCPAYSSGAYRFARTIADAIRRDQP
jgi:hypothetical protein